MAEYLPIRKTKSAYLRRNEKLEIQFKPKKPGPITLMAFARWERYFPPDPTRRRVALYKPGSSAAVASKTDSGLAHSTFLHYNASASEIHAVGNWTGRVTNLEDSRENFRLSVSYPSDIPLKTIVVPASLVSSFVNATIGQTKIHVTDGNNQSYIKFPASFGVPMRRFTAPRYSYTINLPWPIPDIKINERVNDINSRSVDFALRNASAQFSNGSMRLTVQFEHQGKEILGTFHAHLRNMKLIVNLGLETRNKKISYIRNNVDVDFQCSVDLVGVPDWLESKVLDPIIGYSRKIRNSVENAVSAIFSQESTRRAFSDAITAKVQTLLGANAKIYSVKVQGGKLTVKYYNA